MSFASKYSSHLGKLRQWNDHFRHFLVFLELTVCFIIVSKFGKKMVKYLLRYCGYRFDPVDPMI
jgi:hypothetical protein